MNRIKHLINRILNIRLVLKLNKKINNILSKASTKVEIDKTIVRKNLNLWRAIDKSHNVKWMKVCSGINGIIDYSYISEITYYKEVEPRLNNASFAEAYSDKNFYSYLLRFELMPKTYFRCINGVSYNEDFINTSFNQEEILNKIDEDGGVVIKSSIETGGGRGVDVILKESENFEKFCTAINSEKLNSIYGQNFIIQEYIIQHDFFSQFNSSSVNTVRIFTYRSVTDEQIHIIQAVLRVGKKGSLVDNQASGGLSCGVSLESGDLNDFAVDKYGNRFESINSITLNGNFKVPQFDELQSISKDIARSYRYHRLLGFDLTVTKQGKVKLIEINNKNNEINFYQMNNGPLFRQFSSEIIEYCKTHSKTINLDFNI